MAKTGLARLLSGRPARENVSHAEKDKDKNEDEALEDGEDENAAEDDNEDEALEDGEDENAAEDDDEEKAAGVAASGERARIRAILGSPAAKGRESLAQHLAINTSMSPKAAVAALKASPVSSKGRLDARMKGVDHPSIGAGGASGAGGGDSETEPQAAARLASYVNTPRAPRPH